MILKGKKTINLKITNLPITMLGELKANKLLNVNDMFAVLIIYFAHALQEDCQPFGLRLFLGHYYSSL